MANSDTYEFGSYKGLAFEIPHPFNRTGYQFKHWTLTSQDSGESYGEGEEVEFNEDTDLYAQWTANTYKVRFNANGGTGTMNDQPFTYDEQEKALASNEFDRTGYTYLGWSTSSDDEQAQYSDRQLVRNLTSTNNGIVNLFAIWGINSYLVTFDPNGGTFTENNLTDPISERKQYGTSLSEPSVSRTGHTLAHWNPPVPATVEAQDNVYTALWNVNQYTITFDANGGEGGITRELDYGSALNAPNVTRTGYTFNGWEPNVPASVPLGGATYTAQWQINQYTATFDANDGDGSTVKTQDYGTSLSAPTVTRTGYTFTGWTPSVPETMPASNNIYTAQWRVNQYTITFDARGGTGGWSQQMDYGEQIIPPEVTWTGHTFSGWSSTVPETVPAHDMSFEALWDVNRYNVTFNANGGEGGWSDQLPYGTVIEQPTVTRTGYTFLEWIPEVDDTVPANDVTYTAQWEINQYTVTFNANGGVGGTSSSQNYGTAIVAPTVTRTGYTFTGWSPSVAATVPANDVIYTAQWQINQYTATFNANGGTGGTTKTQDYDTELTAPIVTRNGYTFNGWNPSVPSTMPVNGGTYTAQWTANTYQVTFNKQNGTGGSDSVTATYGSAMPQATPPTRTGYVFGGYYDGTNGTGIQYYNSDGTSARTWDKTSDTTLYAKWSEDNVNVTYHRNFAEQEEYEEEQEN